MSFLNVHLYFVLYHPIFRLGLAITPMGKLQIFRYSIRDPRQLKPGNLLCDFTSDISRMQSLSSIINIITEISARSVAVGRLDCEMLRSIRCPLFPRKYSSSQGHNSHPHHFYWEKGIPQMVITKQCYFHELTLKRNLKI